MTKTIERWFKNGFFKNPSSEPFERELDERVRQSFDHVRILHQFRRYKGAFTVDAEIEALSILKNARYTHATADAKLRALMLVHQYRNPDERSVYHVDAAGELPVEFTQSYEYIADHRISHDTTALQYSIFRHPADWEQGKDNYLASQQLSAIRRCEKFLQDGHFLNIWCFILRLKCPALSDTMRT